MNADRLLTSMVFDVKSSPYKRSCASPVLPDSSKEAPVGLRYELTNLRRCLDRADRRWAVANVLQFFSFSEEAKHLRRYNRHADRFLTGDRWVGAYGAYARPQLTECVTRLRCDPSTRRAVVTMDGFGEDMNRPHCWTSLHFIRQAGDLHLLVYQRSLNLAVAPYDLSLLAHVLRWTAFSAESSPGRVLWFTGSLHGELTRPSDPADFWLPIGLLVDRKSCLAALRGAKLLLPEPYEGWLHG